ncbi:FUSC family protein [Streptomyces bauhiniae]|uniref:FUSC family protein n=1 Tax=Streptomyces bauhiniae TaxID=2340725 RepID=A0A4Z1D9Y2_9ACTN|nr:FUSC family protein [Streptomyces bauhiniae]TGN79439.1 FUSC family protein [Streptomyces bauhiniae]
MSTHPPAPATGPAPSGVASGPPGPSAHPEAPHARLLPGRVGGPPRWWDWALALDPGLGRLQTGWRVLLSMITSLTVGYGLSRALGLPAVLGMTVGGVLGLVSAFLIAENTRGRLARALLWLPVPFSAALPVSAAVRPYRVASMCLLVVGLVLVMVLARFGPLGLLSGTLIFVALLVGEMIPLPLAQCGDLFGVAVGTAVALLAARLLLCPPTPREDLLRTQRAFVVEARRITGAAATALEPGAGRAAALRRVHRALRGLNTTTLIIDGRLAQPELAADPEAAELLHQYLFDAELALHGIGEAVTALARHEVPDPLRRALVEGLVIARDTPLGRADALRPVAVRIRDRVADTPGLTAQDDAVRALARRIGDLLDALADSLASWLRLGRRTSTSGASVPFQPTVVLENGRPAGTGPATQRVVTAHGGRGLRRIVPALRAPLQAATAGAITLPIAVAVNPGRHYWGLVGVMVALLGTNTTRERLRKLGDRAAGTVVGGVLGVALLRLIGPGHVLWTLLVIVAGLSIGAACMQRRYAYLVVGLVAALVQVYGLFTPYDAMERLLVDRLADNVLGMLVATVCCLLILPVPTRKVTREAVHGYLSAVEELLDGLAERWRDPTAAVRPRGAARAVEAALHQVDSAYRPLVRMPRGTRGRSADTVLGLLGTATRHARSLAVAPSPAYGTGRIMEVLTSSLRALDHRVTTGEHGGTWTRVGPLVSALRPAGHARPDRALCELASLDQALAAFAQEKGMTVVDAVGPDTLVTVRGAVRCPEHDDCEVSVTVLDDRGTRRAQVRSADGGYTVTGLPRGAYTLIVSSPAHPPRAQSLLIRRSGHDVRHDITVTG